MIARAPTLTIKSVGIQWMHRLRWAELEQMKARYNQVEEALLGLRRVHFVTR